MGITAQVVFLGLFLCLGSAFADVATSVSVATDAQDVISVADIQLAASSDELFAIVGGSQCAEQLYYGPTVLSTSYSGSYFSTSTQYGAVPHDQWVQIVTSDGVTELFRIYWQFSTKKS